MTHGGSTATKRDQPWMRVPRNSHPLVLRPRDPLDENGEGPPREDAIPSPSGRWLRAERLYSYLSGFIGG